MADERPVLMMVEDDIGLQKQMRWSFDDYNVLFAQDRESALALLRRHEPKVVTLDLGLPPDPDGTSEDFATLEQIVGLAPGTKVIVLTGQNDRSNALKAIGAGAYDFFAKPFEAETLGLIIGRAFRLADLEAENRLLLARQAGDTPLDGLLTRDPTMQKLSRQVERLAPTNATVLLHGESGTGKEVFARALHQLSPRRDKRFVAINCAAIPEALLESELFGHEKGAFTGAVKQTQGKIEVADGGTLFLDEIGDMPLTTQAKLLVALERGRFRRLGATAERVASVRVIAATNSDLQAKVDRGDFRADLYYRLKMFAIDLVPLRDRGDDVFLLTDYFVQQFCRKLHKPVPFIPPETQDRMRRYAWPGNVRELRNELQRAILLNETGALEPESLPLERGMAHAEVEHSTHGLAFNFETDDCSLATVERKLFEAALRYTRGNVSETARLLGLTRGGLRHKMDKLNL